MVPCPPALISCVSQPSSTFLPLFPHPGEPDCALLPSGSRGSSDHVVTLRTQGVATERPSALLLPDVHVTTAPVFLVESSRHPLFVASLCFWSCVLGGRVSVFWFDPFALRHAQLNHSCKQPCLVSPCVCAGVLVGCGLGVGGFYGRTPELVA
jgi:hypothetical protein